VNIAVQEVDRENVGICLDLWNLWQDAELVPGIRSAPDRVFLLQVSDWRTPRSGSPWSLVRQTRGPADALHLARERCSRYHRTVSRMASPSGVAWSPKDRVKSEWSTTNGSSNS
jgi:sugar phosphate isomerase/epimerase